jgi:hypothetical protein
MGRILSVNITVPERSTAKRVGITGINKQPVDGPVAVHFPGQDGRAAPSPAPSART